MLNSSFLSTLGKTASASTSNSALNAQCAKSPLIEPGVYGRGLVTILDEASSQSLLSQWSWLVPNSSVPFALTGFGDVFFLEPDKGAHFLEVQVANVEFIDSDAVWVVNEFLAQPTIIEKVLRRAQLEVLVETQRAIRYGEVFILRPWELLGGDRQTALYDIGDVETYLCLVGGTLKQVLHSTKCD